MSLATDAYIDAVLGGIACVGVTVCIATALYLFAEITTYRSAAGMIISGIGFVIIGWYTKLRQIFDLEYLHPTYAPTHSIITTFSMMLLTILIAHTAVFVLKVVSKIKARRAKPRQSDQ